MTRQSDGRFTFETSEVEHDARYQVVAGDARSDIYSIRVLQRPAVLQFAVQYVYPPYLEEKPRRVVNTNGLIEAQNIGFYVGKIEGEGIACGRLEPLTLRAERFA